MEERGAINCYSTNDPRGLARLPRLYTINLAAGVTPMFTCLNGTNYVSAVYVVPARAITVTHGWYRPSFAEYSTLPPADALHILRGGLLLAGLRDALVREVIDDEVAPRFNDDPVEAHWDYERFQEWCLVTYGVRLPAGRPEGGFS